MIRGIFLLATLVFFSCNKKIDTNWDEFLLEDGTGIRDFHYEKSTNTLTGAGGNVWKKGVVFNTNNSGETWSQDSISANELYSVLKKDGGWMFTGLYGSLIETDDNFQNINTHNNHDVNVYTAVSIVDSVVIVTGYNGFTNGIVNIFEFHKGISESHEYKQSIRCLHYSPSRRKHFAGGYGIGIIGDQRMGNTEIIEVVKNDQIQKILEDKNGAIYYIGYSGKVYVSPSENQDWQVYNIASSFFRNPAINTGCVLENGYILVAGERGNVFMSTDSGKKWSKIEAPNEEYIGIGSTSNHLFLSTRSGKLIRLSIEELIK